MSAVQTVDRNSYLAHPLTIRNVAGDFGFLILSQDFTLPLRYGASMRFDTMPSRRAKTTTVTLYSHQHSRCAKLAQLGQGKRMPTTFDRIAGMRLREAFLFGNRWLMSLSALPDPFTRSRSSSCFSIQRPFLCVKPPSSAFGCGGYCPAPSPPGARTSSRAPKVLELSRHGLRSHIEFRAYVRITA